MPALWDLGPLSLESHGLGFIAGEDRLHKSWVGSGPGVSDTCASWCGDFQGGKPPAVEGLSQSLELRGMFLEPVYLGKFLAGSRGTE